MKNDHPIRILPLVLALACAAAADAQEVRVNAQASAAAAFSDLAELSSGSAGGSLGVEARGFLLPGLVLGLDFDFQVFQGLPEWLKSLNQKLAMARLGYRIPIGSAIGLSPRATAGIGFFESRASYAAGSLTNTGGFAILAGVGLVADVPLGPRFSLRGGADFLAFLESGNAFFDLPVFLGVAWRVGHLPGSERERRER